MPTRARLSQKRMLSDLNSRVRKYCRVDAADVGPLVMLGQRKPLVTEDTHFEDAAVEGDRMKYSHYTR